MKNYLKLTGLMMSALLCLFTSCEKDDDNTEPTGVATVQVEMFVASETLDWAEGSFVVTFLPSGETAQLTANNIIFAIDANPVTDAGTLKLFKSAKVKKATLTATCNRSDKKISVTPNLKVKQGTATTDDMNYDYEVAGIIKYQERLGKIQSNADYKGQRGLKGTAVESYLNNNRNLPIVSLDVK